MKLSDLFSKPKMPNFLHGKAKKGKRPRLLKIWKKFVRQIPREFRAVTKSHKHFILLGDDKSGKSDLVHNIIEQSQNIYPFEVEFIKDDDLQFYLGPKQIVQELSLNMIKDRTISLRRSMIKLWKRLFIKDAPTVVIAYNCWLENSMDVREVNKLARLLAGKLSLISELSKAPIHVRIALTHLDKLEGYLEFARFIKQHNIAFKIPLTSNFESETLAESLNRFRDEHLSLILTSTSASDYLKILHFFNELPGIFGTIEEFLRGLTTGSETSKILLESLTFTSNFEPYTSYSSFDWVPRTSNSIFYRHPMLKHQITAAACLLISFGLIFNNFIKDCQQITLSKEGIDSLIFSQPKVFIEEVIPSIERVNQFRPQEGYLPILPRFYKKELRETNQALACGIRRHILEPNLRKLMLQDASELKVIYILGLIHATRDNRMGKHIMKNLHEWTSRLGIDDRLIKSYVNSGYKFDNSSAQIDYLDKINISTPLSDQVLWLEFLAFFKDLIEQPVFTGQDFTDLHDQAEYLIRDLRKFSRDPHAFAISKILRETSSQMLGDFDKNVKLLKWIEENNDQLDTFLSFVCQSCPAIPDVSNLNVSQFFSKLKEVADMNQRENHCFRFILDNEEFSFETQKWVNLAVTHMIERLINNYIVANKDTQGEIFFRHTSEIPSLPFESHRNEFPYFPKPIVINGRYTRLAFEKNVRNTSESLINLLEELPINDADKERFTHFIKQELLSYAKAYQDKYERLYAASDIRTSNLEETKVILKKILLPSSYLAFFLDAVTHHTEVFSDSTTCHGTLSEMNHFYFLPPLMAQEKDKKSPFQGYQDVIRKVLAQLNFQKESSGGIQVLDKHLTPAASIALSLLRNDPDSYANEIAENLSEIGVPSDYHSLFLAPIKQVYNIGIKDLKKGIDRLWKESLEPQLAAFFEKRPFNPNGTLAASLEEVQKMTSPAGNFYRMVKEIISPLSLMAQGVWHPNPSSELKLSQEQYAMINRLAKVSQLLWDSEGNPQAIRLNVQSCPFRAGEKVYPAPVLSYLITGEESLHNFNQSPSWHEIKIDWWKENTSIVAVELANKNNSRSYRDEKVTNTLWSFFELLKKGQEEQSNIWQWQLGNHFSEDISKIGLQFETNPWELFQIYTKG